MQELMTRITSGHYVRMQRDLGFDRRDEWVRSQLHSSVPVGLSFARLMLQPAALGASSSGGGSSSSSSSSLDVGVVDALGGHGSLWYGNYGDHYTFHRFETVQVIFVEASDVGSLVMLSAGENRRVTELVERHGQDGPWMIGLKVTGDEHVRMGSVSMAVKIASGKAGRSTAISVHDIPQGYAIQEGVPLAGRGANAELTGCVVEAFRGFGTLAYEGYLHESFNEGIFLRMASGHWCFHWGQNQQPVVFSRLPVREGMSFIEPTDARDSGKEDI
jgi:hypothetical protein